MLGNDNGGEGVVGNDQGKKGVVGREGRGKEW